MSDRTSGVLLHISSLPSEYGIGDLGPHAFKFVDFLFETKQRYWQILPINPTEAVGAHSPYSSPSAFAGNILLISPEALVSDKIVNTTDIVGGMPGTPSMVDYDAVVSYKNFFLDRAYQNFRTRAAVRKTHESAFNHFIAAHAHWLDDYALFVTIKEHFEGKIWTGWPESFRRRDAAALKKFAQARARQIEKVKFLQFLFFTQWFKLKDYCRSRDIQLIGDMPIYVSLDSVDVWVYPRNYKLDDNLQPVAVAGVPPDYFSETGQRWGNPVYRWEELRETRFSWWVERVRCHLQLYDMVRIDHFRGLVQYWEIPAGEQTAVNGHWEDAPTDDLFKTLEARCTKPLPIIAEDLGHITDDVRGAMRRFDFPGMKVLLFAFNGDMVHHPYLPHNFTERCVVYTGTHDNNTVLGWFRDEATECEIHNLEQYIHKKVSADSVGWDFIRLAFDSKAEVAIIPLQDILGLGGEARMNTPATIRRNWRWRVASEAFTETLRSKLRDLTIAAKRA